MRSERRPPARAALVLVGAAALALGACRADLVVPQPRESPSPPDVVFVQPFVRVIGDDGLPPPYADFRVDPSYYRPEAAVSQFRLADGRGRFPEPVAAPFVLRFEAQNVEGLLLDVFPADGETLVVDLRASNLRVEVDPGVLPALPLDSRSRALLGFQIETRSAHVEVPSPRTRSFSIVLRQQWVEGAPTAVFTGWVPAEVDELRSIDVEWRWDDTEEVSRGNARIRRDDIAFADSLVLRFVSTARPLDLNVQFGGGAYTVPEFSTVAWSTADPDVEHSVSVPIPSVGTSSRVYGFAPEFRLSVDLPAGVPAPSADRIVTWDGLTPITLDVGPHRLTVVLEDAEGAPLPFTGIEALRLSSSRTVVDVVTDADGVGVVFLPPGSYRLLLSSHQFDGTAPASDPVLVEGDTQFTWRLPR